VMVVFARASRPTGDGLGKAFCLGLSTPAAVAAGLAATALPLLCGWRAALAALAGNALLIVAARAYFYLRIGGVTGDCLGAVCQFSEVLMLLIFICPFFT